MHELTELHSFSQIAIDAFNCSIYKCKSDWAPLHTWIGCIHGNSVTTKTWRKKTRDLANLFRTDTCRKGDGCKCSFTKCDFISILITAPLFSPRTSLFSGSRRNPRCFSEPTLTTLIRPSSTMRSMTPSACWRRLWTWCPPPPSGSLCPGSTDIQLPPLQIDLYSNLDAKTLDRGGGASHLPPFSSESYICV